MNGFRRALLLATVDRYLGLVINFVTLMAVSRLLSPEEVGTYVVGMGIVALALSLRGFASSEVLIQQMEMTREDVRTSQTILLGLTVVISGALFASAPWFAASYAEGGLARFLRVAAAAALVGTIAAPIAAILRREMAFGTLAVISVAANLASAAVTLGLAALGFSYMSFAWALLAGAAATALLSLCARPHLWIFRPALSSWRGTLEFGGYNGSLAVVRNAYESLPQLVLGRILPLDAVGLYNRALTVSAIPDKFILASLLTVIFPAFAAKVHKGHDLKQPYLRLLEYVAVVYWPVLIVLALLAHPIVLVLMGQQWLGVVPLARIMALASLVWFPAIINAPVLIAVGAIRHNLMSNLISLPLSALMLCLASPFGVEAMAASQFLALPFQMYIAFRFVRLHVPFRWTELAAALRKSGAVTLCSVVGPCALVALTGFRLDLSVAAALGAGFLAVLGWLGGLWLTHHPVLLEIRKAVDALGNGPIGRWFGGVDLRLLGRRSCAPRAGQA